MLEILIAMFLFAPAIQPATQPTTPPRVNEMLLTVTRVDVARAYLQFDRAFHDHPPSGEKVADVNREFDRLTMEFAQRRHAVAVRGFHQLTDALDSKAAPQSAEAKLARALRVRIAPFVASPKTPVPLRVRISPMYAVEIDHPTTLRLQVTAIESDAQPITPLIDREIVIERNGLGPSLTLQQPKDTPEGRYRIEIVAADGYRVQAGDWYVTERPIERTRYENQQRLQTMHPDSPQLGRAVAMTAARNSLLTTTPSENESTRMLLNPIELSRSIAVEIAELEAGRNPFVGRPDDYWRTIPIGAVHVAARLYAPQSALKSKSAPLLIALHGAGGDENMFFDGLGQGEVKKQAERLGIIVIAPATDFSLMQAGAMDAIYESLRHDYAIDKSRIYVLGHSLGALTAQRWNTTPADGPSVRPAAICQVAGAIAFPQNAQQNAKIAPTLLLAGELDPMFPVDRLELIATDARKAGLAVEFRKLPKIGHTLGIGQNLRDVFDWFFQHPTNSTLR